ncbi:MAG: EAL domain-containing protein [Betaproteobacteria bacterium]|nr:EAL domain-containing protein [Betaproteobacteria bacterium]
MNAHLNHPVLSIDTVSDAELIRRLTGTILNRETALLAEEVGDIFRVAFGGTEGFCYLAENPDRPDALDALPERWRTDIEKILQQETAISLPAKGMDTPPGLCCPLQSDGKKLGAVCVSGQAGSATETLRLQHFADLAAEFLNIRFIRDQHNRNLRETEERNSQQQQIIDHIHDSVITMDMQGYITCWNKGAESLFGYTSEEAVGLNIVFLYADEEEDDALLYQDLFNMGGREMVVHRRKKTGETFWASLTLSLIRDKDDHPSGIIGYLSDITERLQAEEKLRLQAAIFECSDEGIIIIDPAGSIASVNKAFTKITGYASEEIIGKSPEILRSSHHSEDFYLDVSASLHDAGHWIGEAWGKRKSGESFPVWMSISRVHGKDDSIAYYFAIFTDIAERKNAEKQIYRLAYYDTLTGLPNRTMLYTHLKQALIKANRNQLHGAILFISLDRFKQVNDSLGHDAGDLLLKEVASSLTDCVREEDVVARIGGDEFVVALLDISAREHAATVAKKILSRLSQPITVNGHELLISSSIGISVYPDNGDDAETLLKCADVAMRRAKRDSSHNGIMFFSQDMNQRSLEKLKLENNLRRAMERNELRLNYQPQIDLASGKIVGAEVLLRWDHDGAIISPTQFISIAEETGLIIPIGEWILETVCARNKQWQEAGLPIVKLAVNISAKQFRQSLPHLVEQILDRHQLDPSYLELEITESVIMQNAEGVISMMAEFQRLGITLSLDDFGTGYSSLSYLKRFPIDTLKIDQSFIRGLPNDTDDTAITRAIISLAKNLGLRVIAEGVETAEQLDFLRLAECDEIQGFYYSHPLSEDDFVSFLRQ